MSTISSKDFSVVIQGPIIGKPNDLYENQLTKQCIESVRKYLPECEIIISTWKGQEIEHLTFDKIVFNEDPGAVTYNDFELKNVYNNNNRQIVSTFNGLKLASRKYSIKTRADIKLISTNFYTYLNKYDSIYKYKFFDKRILVSTYFSRNPEKVPLLFHISDLFQIGLTKDLLQLWDIEIQPEPETTRGFKYSQKFPNDPFPFNNYKMKYASEQYIWYGFTKKKGLDLSLNYFCEIPLRLIQKATISIIDNFVILSNEQIGIELPERLIHGEKKLYTNSEWLIHYENICNKKSLLRIYSLIATVKLVSLNYIFKNKIKDIKNYIRNK
jgi:hypothetical protein